MRSAKALYFQSRESQFLKEAERLNLRFKWIATSRIILFLLSLILIIYFANARNAWAIFYTSLPSIALFVLVVKNHNKVKYQRDHAEYLTRINHEEIERLKGDIKAFDPGEEFIDEEHNYSSDLDIFGQNSLFQLVNRTATEPGKKILASWLQTPADRSEIQSRQEAVLELSDQVDWRQQFQAAAMHSQNVKTDFNQFSKWLNEPELFEIKPFFRIASYLLPILTLSATAGIIFDFWPYQVLLIPLAISGIILSKVLKFASETTEKASKSLQVIDAYRSLIRSIESRAFTSDYLKDIQNSIFTGSEKASEEIARLGRIMQKFDARANALFFMIDLLFLLDIHWLIEAESWKKKNAHSVTMWIEGTGRVEAISSLAGTRFTHDYPLPGISEERGLKLIAGGHPLIKPQERVLNDFAMSSNESSIIITGSNMSGKSTFLRTIGINMVLAFAGGPVCCKEAVFTVMNVFTSMRTHDNLEEHISSFYAELRRIRKLLKLLDTSSIPVFYLLDEILKGTNSDDRHLGAESLVIQLLPLDCMGIISTHDLALSELERKYLNVTNYSFNSIIAGDEIIFDYKINTGICRGFNASKLMEKMGIRLKSNYDGNL